MTDRIVSTPSIAAIKLPCRAAALSAITLSGLQTVDGEVLAAGDRVLVTAQGAENGIYLVASGAWTRAPDFNGDYDVEPGTLVWVWGGTEGWYDVTTEDPVIGEAIEWRFGQMHRPTQSGDGNSVAAASAGLTGSAQGTTNVSAAGSAVCSGVGQSGANLSGTGLAIATAAITAGAEASLSASAQGLALSDGEIPATSPVWIFSDDDTQRYDLATDIVSVHTMLSTTQNEPWAAIGNAEKAILGGGTTIEATCIKYTYADEVTASSSTLGGTYFSRAGMQNATTGYFVGGYTSAVTVVDKVLFSTETRSAGTSLPAARALHASQGNSTRGISAGGTNNFVTFAPIATTMKYTYATDAVVGGSTVSPARLWLGAAGNTSAAIFSSGTDALGAETATSNKYTYAGDVVTSATSLPAVHQTLAGGGTNSAGLFHGPTGASLNTATTLYEFATDAVTSGTDLHYGHSLPSMKAESVGGL